MDICGRCYVVHDNFLFITLTKRGEVQGLTQIEIRLISDVWETPTAELSGDSERTMTENENDHYF